MDYAPAPVSPESIAYYRSAGITSDVSFPSLMERNRREFGSRTAVIEGDNERSWIELIDAASRFGGFLQANGVGAGDVVVWQLPNWWESLVVAYGIWAAGAISSPVVPIYREHELTQVLAAVQPKVVVTAAQIRDRNHVDMITSASELSGVSPQLKIVVRGSAAGWTSFDDTMNARSYLAPNVDPDAPALVGWTSGTTSGSKGVVHSSRGFLSIPMRSARMNANTWLDRSYMPAPIAHATGLLSAIATPIYVGSSAVLRDGWDAELAVDDMLSLGVTTTSGSAVFMSETLAAMRQLGIEKLPLSSGYPCGGSTIPTELGEACDDVGMQPARSWGMTECPGVTGSSPRLHSRIIRTASDGLVLPGCEVRLVGDDGAEVAPGTEGEAWVRGPQRTLGYLDPQHTAEAFDADGWFCTGDMGRIADDGSFSMTGRRKEIINRGGEKLSSREIEDAIARHAMVREVAVVSAPHPRLGEQPAAFVLGDAGVSPEMLSTFLHDLGMASQKVPRVWRFVDQLPRTASGKVIKRELELLLQESE